MTFAHSIRPKRAAWIGLVLVIVAAAIIFLLMTDQGAGVIARARCANVWLSSDSNSFQACYDLEREQILEERRHTPDD